MSKEHKQKNNWRKVDNDNLMIVDKTLTAGFPISLFANDRTGEFKIFNSVNVKELGINSVVKQLNK